MHETKGVAELHGFEVVEGDPDVVGWEVLGRDGRRIGVVAELLADPENPSSRYLEVLLDHPLDHPAAGGAPETQLTGDAVETPARTIGEAFVRDSLLDIENQMTAGGGPGFDRGEGRTLIPAGQARLDTGKRQIRLESLPAESA